MLAERGYLQKVIDGTVQLYLYDPSSLSIVEMIGTPGPETTAINTYIPGTFTSLFSFYHGDVQQVGSWLDSSDTRFQVRDVDSDYRSAIQLSGEYAEGYVIGTTGGEHALVVDSFSPCFELPPTMSPFDDF